MPRTKVRGKARHGSGLVRIVRSRHGVRPRFAVSAEEYARRHGLSGVLDSLGELARGHFGGAFTGMTLALHVDDAEPYLEAEVGVTVAPDHFLGMRDAYLDAVERAYPEMNWDRLHVSVRIRASACPSPDAEGGRDER